MTQTANTPDSEKDPEFQEHERILSPEFLSTVQITDLLTEDVDGVQEKLRTLLNFKNLQTCLKDAILVDYYVSGFLWAKEMDFSIVQCSKFMTLLDMLLQNLKTLHMSLEDNIKWLGEVMAEIGPNHSQRIDEWTVFDVKQANAITDYLKISIFQHYKLYEFMFCCTREEIVIGTEFFCSRQKEYRNFPGDSNTLKPGDRWTEKTADYCMRYRRCTHSCGFCLQVSSREPTSQHHSLAVRVQCSNLRES
ncbi:ciliary-associated calcium-binding coiled-coil protein 1 isoform X2 [Octodon degus]|uniref:Ciliary-associated calcium-binding coiled-coil protein 1 isoform X2 n=1 Tax=Octodon degus TaxID=10160 RepID=A0A6P6EI67_OCTDE|nr:ciliary-associated calcium-binding coiled-coil protein 1 isoform X2 [Octodon degus]